MNEIFELYLMKHYKKSFSQKPASIWEMTFHFSFTAFLPILHQWCKALASSVIVNQPQSQIPNQSPSPNPHSRSLRRGRILDRTIRDVTKETPAEGLCGIWTSSRCHLCLMIIIMIIIPIMMMIMSTVTVVMNTGARKDFRERTYLGRIKSRSSSLLPSAIYVWISTQSENRNLFPTKWRKNLADKKHSRDLFWGDDEGLLHPLQWRMALISCHFKPAPTHVICYNSNLPSHPQPDDHHPGDDPLDGDHLVDVNESESQHEKRKALPPPCRQKSLSQASEWFMMVMTRLLIVTIVIKVVMIITRKRQKSEFNNCIFTERESF